MWCHAAPRSRMRASPRKSVRPATAASAAMIRAAPRSQSEAVLQAGLPVRQKIRSQTNVATRKATGNGISMGWSGCPAIWAVLCGLGETIVFLLRGMPAWLGIAGPLWASETRDDRFGDPRAACSVEREHLAKPCGDPGVQGPAQQAPRPEQTRPDRLGSELEVSGGLLDAHLLNVTHHEHEAEACGK